MIGDATGTKQAIDEAYESIENANQILARTAPAPTMAPAAAKTVDETDLFGGWGDDAPAPQYSMPSVNSAPLTSADSNYNEAESVDDSQPYHAQDPALAPARAPSYSYIQQESTEKNMYSGGGYTGGGGDGHNRNLSGFGEVMGSGPTQGFTSPTGAQTFDSIPHTISMKEVEDLKYKSKEADDVAKDAEASRRQIEAQLEELRRLADEAESKAREASEKPVKKKGLLGRGGGQKKDAVRMGDHLAFYSHETISNERRLICTTRRRNCNNLQWMRATRRNPCF